MQETPKAKKPTKTQIARFVELKAKKSKLESEARQFETEINLLHDVILSYMEDQDRTAAVIHGHQVTVEQGRPYVSWKKQFIRAVDSETAAQLVEDAPRPPKVKVTPPA